MDDTLGSQKQRGFCMNEPRGKKGSLKDGHFCRISEDQLGSECYESSHCERASFIAEESERAERVDISVLAGRQDSINLLCAGTWPIVRSSLMLALMTNDDMRNRVRRKLGVECLVKQYRYLGRGGIVVAYLNSQPVVCPTQPFIS